jgi:hypothetical protein
MLFKHDNLQQKAPGVNAPYLQKIEAYNISEEEYVNITFEYII